MRRGGSAPAAAVAVGLMTAGWVLAAAWPGAGARAAVGANGSGFGVSPAYGQVTIPADKPQVSYSVELSNFNPAPQEFSMSVVDFGSLDETGGIAFLGTPASELSHKFGLAAWMSLPQTDVTVPAGGSLMVPVLINNPDTLAPGGHYGAILATALTAGSGGSDSVGVKQVLSSLVLVTKQGGLIETLNLAGQKANSGWWHLPDLVTQRYHNTGNVHLVPRGVVSVKDPWGHEVERSAINEDSSVVLPQTYRRYSTSLITDGKAWLPGRYTLVASYRYDGTTQTHTLVSSFWYVGAVVVWLVVLLAVAAGAGLAWWLWRGMGKPWPKRRRHKSV